MQLKDWLFAEDRGVSPVIGVILMVAITVILAAVIATFVMNMGPDQETVPAADWDISEETTPGDPYFSLEHTGGESVTASELVIRAEYDGSQISWDADGTGDNFTLDSDHDTGAADELRIYNDTDESDVTSTDEYAGFEDSSGDIADADSIQIVWEASDSDQSEVLDEWER